MFFKNIFIFKTLNILKKNGVLDLIYFGWKLLVHFTNSWKEMPLNTLK